MYKKIFLVFSCLVFLFGFRMAKASIVISEIMYNPSGDDTKREWVELYNDGDSIVNISSGSASSAWRFDDGSSSLHIINSQLSIPAKGFAILASDKSTFVSEYSYSGLIADTTMTLDNTGIVKLWNGDNPRVLVASASYNSSQGANNDGNSLQLINGSWKALPPTPGAENIMVTGGGGPLLNSDNSSSTSTSTQTSSSATIIKIVEPPKIRTKVTASSISYVGIPMEFSVNTTGYSNEPLYSGKYYWNFGDGDSKEINANHTEKLFHTYYYPGEYNLTLEYYTNNFFQNPETVTSMAIKVVPIGVSISRVGDEKDFFIEISNSTDNDLDLSKWSIASSNKNFIFPKNTNVMAKGKIVLSPKITGFVVGDKDNLKLLNPNKEIVFTYNFAKTTMKMAVSAPKKEAPVTVVENKENIPESHISSENNLKINASSSKQEDVLNPELSATALLSNNPSTKNKGVSYIVFFSFVGLLILGGVAVYYIRRDKVAKNPGDDFDIIDE